MGERWTRSEVVAWVTRRLTFEAFLAERSTWPAGARPRVERKEQEPPAAA